MTYLMQVALPYFTGNADDVVVNTFHFDWGGGSPPAGGDFNNLVSNVLAAYQNWYEGEADGVLTLAPWINQTNVRFTVYDLDDAPPRVPVADQYDDLGVVAGTNSSTPMEASMCVSYRANYSSGIPRARQRGRIYLGGFTANGMTPGTTSSFPQFSALQISNVGLIAEALRVAALADDWIWVVYSRAGAASYPIVGGWVDAEIDTQRRRGNVLTGTRDPWGS